MNLNRLLSITEHNVNWALGRLEFFRVKSQSKYAGENVKHYEEWSQNWADIHECVADLTAILDGCGDNQELIIKCLRAKYHRQTQSVNAKQ